MCYRFAIWKDDVLCLSFLSFQSYKFANSFICTSFVQRPNRLDLHICWCFEVQNWRCAIFGKRIIGCWRIPWFCLGVLCVWPIDRVRMIVIHCCCCDSVFEDSQNWRRGVRRGRNHDLNHTPKCLGWPQPCFGPCFGSCLKSHTMTTTMLSGMGGNRDHATAHEPDHVVSNVTFSIKSLNLHFWSLKIN